MSRPQGLPSLQRLQQLWDDAIFPQLGKLPQEHIRCVNSHLLETGSAQLADICEPVCLLSKDPVAKAPGCNVLEGGLLQAVFSHNLLPCRFLHCVPSELDCTLSGQKARAKGYARLHVP